MINSFNTEAAKGYRQAAISVQKLDGETFIQTDVCPKAGDTILDLGCGTGELSAYLAELVGAEGKVVGVDPDKERIQLARETHHQVKNLSFLEGDALTFPQIGLEPCDIIFSNYALHFMKNKQQVFNNLFTSLKAGGKIALQYISHLPPFERNAYVLLNPENADRILGMYQREGKTKIEQYCLSAGFEITRSVQTECVELVIEYVEELLKWHWSTTHGVFDPSLVTEERLQKYLAPYTDENGKPCLDFRGMKHEMPVCQLLAIKKTTERH